MRMVWALVRGLAVLFIVVTSLFLIAVNFSEADTRYECPGTITSEGAVREKIVFLEIREYRWWVGLWSDSHGSMHLEIPNELVRYFAHLTRTGHQLQVRHGPNGQLQGNFSSLSHTLALASGIGFIDAKCRPLGR